MSRAERKAAAQERTRSRKLAWLQMMKGEMDAGSTFSQAATCVAHYVDHYAKRCPQEKQEILIAWDELCDQLEQDAKKEKREQAA